MTEQTRDKYRKIMNLADLLSETCEDIKNYGNVSTERTTPKVLIGNVKTIVGEINALMAGVE